MRLTGFEKIVKQRRDAGIAALVETKNTLTQNDLSVLTMSAPGFSLDFSDNAGQFVETLLPDRLTLKGEGLLQIDCAKEELMRQW